MLLVTVLIFAGVLEVALRLVFAHSLDYSMEMWKYAVALKAGADPAEFHARSEQLGLSDGSRVSTISATLRDRDFLAKKLQAFSAW